MLPKVSVIVPVKNESRHILKCLKGIAAQSYPRERLEVLVADGMSSDGTRELVELFKKDAAGDRPELEIKLLDNLKGLRASALNIAITKASGAVILRVDARTIIASDYIERCVHTLKATGADNVGGVQRPICEDGPEEGEGAVLTRRAIGLAFSHRFGVGNARFRIGDKSGLVDTVYPGCFRREIFEKVGLFDEESAVISEDSELNQRIREAGGSIYMNKDISAYYYPRESLRDLWRLYFRYGGAKAGNLIKRGKLTAWRQCVPPAFLLSMALPPALGVFEKRFFYPWYLIVSAYVIADICVSLALSVKERNLKASLFLRLLGVFPTMHFAWAVGFWRRLLQRPRPGQYWGY